MNKLIQAEKNPGTETTPWLERKVFAGLTPALLILAVIVLVSLGIHLHNLESIGDANTYYTAAVEAMLDSWSNFFFVAAEPGGSVTIDKPPLGLWIETAFAYVFGVNGLAVSLPNILAGLMSIPLLYYLVKKYLGAGPGLVAAAVMAFTPVVFAADRNNTMDSMLTFTLLLAAWAFIEATERGKLRYLLLGGLLIGLGFNIKMMQVLLPVPAFFALYFLASKEGWGRKVVNLGLATVVILAVSLSWAVAVDAVPEDSRPYIGSSEDNTVMELILGHNGLNRLFGGDHGGQGDGDNDGGQQFLQQGQAFGNQSGNQIGQLPTGQRPAGPPPQDGQNPGEQPGNGGGMGNDEIGSSGMWRFFESQLANESSWLLPFALVAVVLGVFSTRIRLPLEAKTHKALVLWGGWLVTCVVFFSVAAFFHAYYLVMVAPAIGACVALGWAVLDDLRKTKPVLAGLVMLATGALTLGVQVYFVGLYSVSGWYLWAAGLLCAAGVLLVLASLQIPRLVPAGMTVLVVSLLVIPLAWSFLTVDVDQPNVNLPAAYAGVDDQRAGQPGPQNGGDNASQDMVAYLLENQTGKYLLAVPSSHQGSGIVLDTDEPVLYMGGFNGGDPVVDAADLAELVANGDLTYILYGANGNRQGQNGISSWLQSSCSVVPQFSQTNRQARPAQLDGGPQGNVLYMCTP